MTTSTRSPMDHRFRRMIGRDPDESHRTATPLELLFDLTLVVAFSQAGTQMAHLLELGHFAPAVGAFVFSVFAICWAWINYSWLASAFDNDDVFFRVATMVQMLGVLVVALGLPELFHSVTVVVVLVLAAFELLIPMIAERLDGGTPWHAHHIAERYSLLVIITLGEVVLGTILAISAVVEEHGWSVEAGLVAFGGTALAFGLWWVYFTMPSGEVLARHRERGFVWGYGHLLVFGSLAATGAGLHVAANVITGSAHVSETTACSPARRR